MNVLIRMVDVNMFVRTLIAVISVSVIVGSYLEQMNTAVKVTY